MCPKKDCYLVGAGEFAPARFLPKPCDGVFAVDGGYAPLAARGCRVDLLLGDFDSLPALPAGVPLERHPAHKDDTDMLLAARRALAQGYTRLLLFGGTGGRLDHTLANLQVLHFIAKQGAEGFLFGPDYALTVLQPGALRFDAGYEGTLSLFALSGPARGVTLRGLEYPLLDAVVRPDFPIGVSNRFTGAPAEVTVGENPLAILFSDAPRAGGGALPLPVRG